MEQFTGVKYKLKSSDNFEEYLKFIGEQTSILFYLKFDQLNTNAQLE